MEGIDLEAFPKPDVIKQLSQEKIVSEIVEDAGISNASQSDPGYRSALAGGYREVLVRQEVNEQALGLMLAFASGAALDHIGLTYYKYSDGSPVLRLPNELDGAYRSRLQASPEGLAYAGSKGAYEFFAKSASALVSSVVVDSPEPLDIYIYALGGEGAEILEESELETIKKYCVERRAFGDDVRVFAADLVSFSVSASLTLTTASNSEGVRAASEKSLLAFLKTRRVFGGRVVVSQLHAVLKVPGVEEVALNGWSDVECLLMQVPVCVSVNVMGGGAYG